MLVAGLEILDSSVGWLLIVAILGMLVASLGRQVCRLGMLVNANARNYYINLLTY